VILNRLLPALARDHDIAVGLSDRIFPNERGFAATDRFMHYTRDLLVERLFPALDERGRDGQGEWLTFAGLGRHYAVPVIPLGGEVGAARAATERAAAHFRPDVILCCRHDFIVSRQVFQGVPSGAYNLHSGAVPHYRGPFCSFWAALNQEERIGCSLHCLAEKVDTGDIVGTAWRPLDPSATLVRTLLDTYAAGVALFLSLAPALIAGPVLGRPQPAAAGRYYPQPDAGDFATFQTRGGLVAEAEECQALYGRYLPDGLRLESLVPDWKWADE
ncbi:MAG: hypothetical protein LIP77_11015, partial [Planctomycetes bacterium]|nr:hypothetical protein [Planctomycetota bacterium]